MNNDPGFDNLATIDEDLQVPQTRMKSAANVIEFASKLRRNDERRSLKRARVEGLVGGNPPYRASRLRDEGRADRVNANPGTARMYMESGSGAFYDLFSEAPGFVNVRSKFGMSVQEREMNGNEISRQIDRMLAMDQAWDFEMLQSQWQMVLHGRGPLMFEDENLILPRSMHDGELMVPERAKAETKYWESAAIDVDYYPPELYAFIQDEAAGRQVGWRPSYVKKVISRAMSIRENQGRDRGWEWYQQEIKNNSLSYYDDSKIVRVTFCFWKEFDGRITQAIVERDQNTPGDAEFLYIKVGRYASFTECIHPMYFDRGNGGFHHSVTGLGVKMFGAMEAEQRLYCNLMDKAFAPKILFKPINPEAGQKLKLTVLSDYGILPAGWDAVQTPIQGFLTDGLAMFQASSSLMRSNLSSYRQQVAPRETGNPVTAREVTYRASEQSSLSKPTYARYYRQLDLLYFEIVRRAMNPASTDPRAQEFRQRCIAAGVPEEALTMDMVDSVSAVRMIGQGSAMLRREAVTSLAAVAQRLPEEGQQNWLNDFIAANAGQGAVERYNPSNRVNRMASNDEFEAMQCVSMMKVGVPPLVTSTQNPVVYARTYLKAGTQAMESLSQGGNPAEVYSFLSLCGPAALAQLQRFAKDPLRSEAFQALFPMWQKLAQLTEKLSQMIGQQMKAKQEQAGKTQAALSDEQIKTAKAQNQIAISREKLAMQREKHQQDMAQKGMAARQQMAIQDATAASQMHRDNLQMGHDQEMERREMAMAEANSAEEE